MTADSPAMKPNGLYVPLDVNFTANDKLCECSVDAEHVFIRSLALCKRTLNDGVVTIAQLRRECEKLDRDRLDDAVVELLGVGLFTSSGNVILIPSWLKRNPSRANLDDKKARRAQASRLGNHTRWHVNMDTTDPRCEFCFPSSEHVSLLRSDRTPTSDPQGSLREEKRREENTKRSQPPWESQSENDLSTAVAAEEVAEQIFRNAGFANRQPTRGETQTVARALARGWTPDYLANLGTEAAVKAHSNPKGYIDSALNRCANLELPPATPPKPPGPLITCPDCSGMARDYGPDGTLVDIDCRRCGNRRKVHLDETADL